MRKKTSASPCRTLSPEQRAEVEQTLRDAGLLRAATQDEINEMKMRRRASSFDVVSCSPSVTQFSVV
jgi:hypothetical protein